jgi:hypothetical protein
MEENNQPTQVTRDEVIKADFDMMFGKAPVDNAVRATLVEAMVDKALDNGWSWTSGAWASHDFKHSDGTRLEVSQSAARQIWHEAGSPPSRPSFDIAARKGAYVGSDWTPGDGRNADIYVLGHHPLTGEGAEHADPAQWVFYVVPTSKLPPPPQRTMSLSTLSNIAVAVKMDGVQPTVENMRAAIMKLRSQLPTGI